MTSAGSLRNPHLWLLLGMLALGGVLHYAEFLTPSLTNEGVPLPSHSMLRVLFLLPVIYGAFIFGPRGGSASLAVAVLLMVPEALRSPRPANDLVEVGSVALVGLLTMAWFEAQQKEKERRQEAVARLENARLELASHVETIKANEKRLRTIQDVCSLLTQAPDLSPTLHQVLDRVVEVVGVDAGMVFLLDSQNSGLTLAAYRGVSSDFARAVASLRLGEGLNGRVAQSGRPLMVDDASADPRLTRASVREEGIRSELIVPLSHKGRAIGTLCLAVRSLRAFTSDEVNLVTAIGEQLGIAIENGRLYQEVHASEEKYRDLFENATMAILVHDLEGVITAANKASASLIGYSVAELLGTNVNAFFPTHSGNALASTERRLLDGESLVEPYECPLVQRDGTQKVLSLSTRLILEKGQPTGFQHIARDITERRKMRESLDYYIRQVLTAQEEERKRIARELHDDTRQSLLLISQRLDTLASDPDGHLSSDAREYLGGVRTVVLQTLAGLRQLTEDLRPRILDELGLAAALEWLGDDLGRQNETRVTVDVTGTPRPVAPEAELLLFRIAQEALSNVRKHAAATKVRIELAHQQDRVRLSVADDGKGFLVPARVADLAAQGKLGILGMHERARLLNGTVAVHSSPGKGTVVVAELPR